MKHDKTLFAWSLLRISLGWIFLWAFIDKLFGLGFATSPEASWLAGGSPTTGFLKFGTQGPLAPLFQGMAGSAFVDWLFMLGLLCIGVALLLGIATRIAGYAGALLMLLMYLAVLLPEHNPIIDDHIVYAIVLLGLTTVPSGMCSISSKWNQLGIVKKHPWLS